jgi:hypothetical protein
MIERKNQQYKESHSMIQAKCRKHTAEYSVLQPDDHYRAPVAAKVVGHFLQGSQAALSAAHSLLLHRLSIQEHFYTDESKNNIEDACSNRHKKVTGIVKIISWGRDVSNANGNRSQNEISFSGGDAATFFDKLNVFHNLDLAGIDLAEDAQLVFTEMIGKHILLLSICNVILFAHL